MDLLYNLKEARFNWRGHLCLRQYWLVYLTTIISDISSVNRLIRQSPAVVAALTFSLTPGRSVIMLWDPYTYVHFSIAFTFMLVVSSLPQKTNKQTKTDTWNWIMSLTQHLGFIITIAFYYLIFRRHVTFFYKILIQQVVIFLKQNSNFCTIPRLGQIVEFPGHFEVNLEQMKKKK